jgi:hypothetical protein
MNLEGVSVKIWCSVWISVKYPVYNSVGNSAWNSVRDSVDVRLTAPIRREREQG